MGSSFWWLIGIVAVGAIYSWYKRKQHPDATRRDKALWTIQGMSVCLGITLYLSSSSPLGLRHLKIEISPHDSQEAKIQKLIRNDEVSTNAIDELQETNEFLSYAIALYLAFIYLALKDLQKDRTQVSHLHLEDPIEERPLGL
jgi:hypothetical protein